MGVPGFFGWILHNFKNNNIIMQQIYQKVNMLYLDANCLFHPQCFKVLDYYKDKEIDIQKLEDIMIRRIINYINYLINIVEPINGVFISVDGVAPMAKINQQRKRRYKTMYDIGMYNEIKLKHNRPINSKWSNAAITPGTEFMGKLHQSIIEYCKESTYNIKYASYHVPGEGEHKILQDIKDRNKCDDVYVVYGLDADLFFLMMASGGNNIYLLREESEFGGINVPEINNIMDDISEKLCYVSINETKMLINGYIKQMVNIKDYDHTNDFIFLCYLLGNDFLPHIPSIDIKINGMDILIDNYSKILKKLRLPLIVTKNSLSINKTFLLELLMILGEYEDEYFKTLYINYKNRINKRKCQLTDPYEIDVWELDNMINMDKYDPIRFGKGQKMDYKHRYYDTYFDIKGDHAPFIEDLSIQYIEGIIWTFYYYFDKCPSWEWQYIHNHAPFISDLCTYLINVDINNIIFNLGEPMRPFKQLLCVIPPIYNHLLPKNVGELMINKGSPIIYMFPMEFELDIFNKDAFWKCIPLLPTVDQNIINIDDIKLTKDESKRNTFDSVKLYKNKIH